MIWRVAKRQIEKRALARRARNSQLHLADAVRAMLLASPRLWKAYRQAIGAGERQEFLSLQPHHRTKEPVLLSEARAMVAHSRRPITLRDATLFLLKAQKPPLGE